MILTYRYRLKDGRQSDRAALHAQARSVNLVWNYCCEIQRAAEHRWLAGAKGRWPSYFDLTRLTAGSSKELGILSDTILAVCRQFVTARDKARRHPRWRSSRKALAWVPVSHAYRYFRLADAAVLFRGRPYRAWLSRDLPADAVIRNASFACDARGRWYVNLAIETQELREHGSGEVGIDLGLKSLGAMSTGEVAANPRYTARYAEMLAKANRSRSWRRVRAVQAKIANSRRDHLHKVSTAIIRANQRVVIGNVSPSRLKKTWLAKSVSDAGWATFREMLRYKAVWHGVEYQEVDEAWTTRTCSACGSIPASSPKGRSALGMRRWVCSECGADHDRDQNAALNILRAGAERRPPVEGIAA